MSNYLVTSLLTLPANHQVVLDDAQADARKHVLAPVDDKPAGTYVTTGETQFKAGERIGLPVKYTDLPGSVQACVQQPNGAPRRAPKAKASRTAKPAKNGAAA